MMRHELWRAILVAFEDIDHLVAAAAGDLPDRAPVTSASPPSRDHLPRLETAWRELQPERAAGVPSLPSGVPSSQAAALGARPPASAPGLLLPPTIEPPDERDRERLRGLREAVRVRLERLWRELDGEAGQDRIRRALIIYADERVMARLPEYLALSWPLLQTDVTRTTTGGADFFRHIELALHEPRCPQLILEVYYFCLNHGFVGMHANDTVQLDHYRQQLAARMSLPPVDLPARTSAAAEPLPRRWSAWSYYALALLFVLVLVLAFTALSNVRGGGG